MAHLEKSNRYSSIEDHELEDQDLDSDSDTTACSHHEQGDDFLQKGGQRIGRKSSRALRKQNILTWIRWGSIVALQLIMILVLLLREGDKPKETMKAIETGDDINGLFKTRKYLSLMTLIIY